MSIFPIVLMMNLNSNKQDFYYYIEFLCRFDLLYKSFFSIVGRIETIPLIASFGSLIILFLISTIGLVKIMKNNILKYFILIYTLFFLVNSIAENTFTFESEIIEYKDNQNLILAKRNVKITFR